MSELTADRRVGVSSSTRARFGPWAPVAVAFVAFVVASIVVVPRMSADGSARLATFDLNAGQPVPGARTSGAITRNVYGFVVGAFGSGSASLTVPTPSAPGSRTVLVVSAGGDNDLSNSLSVVTRGGKPRLVGQPVRWSSRRVDITRYVAGGRTRLRFQATNSGATPQLIADQVRVVTYRSSAVPDAGRWEVAIWVALTVLLVLAVFRRARRDAAAALAAGLTAFLAWPSVASGAFAPFKIDLWQPAVHAGWIDLDTGLLSGSFQPRSSLAVQLFHLLTPITGTGQSGIRTASILVGVLAVLAAYALGRRIAGLPGALAASACLLLADSFRGSLSSGESTTTLVLAATLFLIAVYEVLRRGDRTSMIVLGVAGGVAILAEPLWWPGVVVALLWLGLREIPGGSRRRALAAAFVALVIVILPNRVSVADQGNGDANADVVRLSTAARNVEFVGRGHGAPPNARALQADPMAGSHVGMAAYVFGDHSLSTVVGGVLSGAYDGLGQADLHSDTKLVGVLAFLVELAGVVVLLLVRRLRLLVVIPALLAAVPWFYADRGAIPHLTSVTGFWPALLAGAATVAHMVVVLATERVLARGPRPTLATRTGELAQRLAWRTRPGRF